MNRFFIGLLIFASASFPAFGVEPDEVLEDPGLEARARVISQQLRCLVCQNETIDESNAPLARDLRIIVRERLDRGDTDEAVIRFIVARYGDYVLLRPPVRPATWLLWFGPAILFALGFVAVVGFYRRAARRTPAASGPLSDDERRRLEGALGSDT